MNKLTAILILAMLLSTSGWANTDGKPSLSAQKAESHAFTEQLEKAKAGDPSAQYLVGKMYRWGQGVPRDYEKAIKWLELAAKNDNINAFNDLLGMYSIGHGVERDSYKAMYWAQRIIKRFKGNKDRIDCDDFVTREQRGTGQ